MSEKNKTELKTLFSNGEVLTAALMADLIDSFSNKKTLGVADPSSSGVSSDIGTVGVATDNTIWFKVGSGDTAWSSAGGALAWGGITGALSDQADLQSALDGKQSTSFTQSFVEADLTAGAITFTHNRNNKFNIVQVYDENDQVILPDEITATDANNTAIDLTSFSPIAGTWNVVIG